jgi:hypothetical protein
MIKTKKIIAKICIMKFTFKIYIQANIKNMQFFIKFYWLIILLIIKFTSFF